jgi:hypothetical protein
MPQATNTFRAPPNGSFAVFQRLCGDATKAVGSKDLRNLMAQP